MSADFFLKNFSAENVSVLLSKKLFFGQRDADLSSKKRTIIFRCDLCSFFKWEKVKFYAKKFKSRVDV